MGSQHGAEVIDLDLGAPFTAARARNAGFRRLKEIAPDLACVQFIDGDCQLVESWPDARTCLLGSAS